jgi:hypothetical protein
MNSVPLQPQIEVECATGECSLENAVDALLQSTESAATKVFDERWFED